MMYSVVLAALSAWGAAPSPSPSPAATVAPAPVEAAAPGVVRPEQVRLLEAARRGELDVVKRLVEAGETVNPPGGARTPLIAAALHSRLAVMEYLLAKGADVNARDRLGRSALWAAVWGDQPEAFRLLLSKDAAVEVSAKTGDTLLFMAVEGGRLEMARELIARGAQVDRPSRNPLWRGYTPLQRAVTLRNAKAVALLVEKGADPRVKNDQGQTAADLAAALPAGPDADAIRALLASEKR
jgi:ankyrin repeat protein